MYSENLEKFIQAVIADGKITDKERAVVHRKAQEEGVDIDEIDVYMEGLIDAMASVKPASMVSPPPQKSLKYGTVSKCPQCGSIIEAGAVKCPDCGYVFRGLEANTSIQRLSKILMDIEEKYRDMKEDKWSLTSNYFKKLDEKATAIKTFPVPTTKEDLLEFIISMKSSCENTSGVNEEPVQKAYKAKYNECMTKAKLLFADDPQFKPLFESKLKTSMSRSKIIMLYFGGLMGLSLLIIVGCFLLSKCS